jgi:uncharacterized protein
MDYVELVKEEILKINQKYIDEVDSYNFWEQHIKYVLKEASELAIKYNADKEVVELGALLHDIALMSNYGTRKEHHINGGMLAKDLLIKCNYPESKIDKVVGCVINHRSSKNATNNEELCVADADILAHFDNLPMIFNYAFNRYNISCNDIHDWMKKYLYLDYCDLSDREKVSFKDKYENIMKVLFIE